jgi:hypothetical protein
MKRRKFIEGALLGSAGLISLPLTSLAETTNNPPIGDPLPAEKVKEFVSSGHNNLARVKEMLEEMPTLIYATWDLGGGDFETALEGAGHVGNKEIAHYLISKGARTNLFVLTMLGKIELVKAYLDIWPMYLNARGPHGFTLLHHANRGGEEARELVAYLQGMGLKETKLPL